MAIRTFRPYTPGTRTRVVTDFSEVTGRKPERSLVVAKHRRKGRNNRGVITCRHRGGGHKRQYRLVDFRRNKHGVPAKVAAIHYDPHRNARLALLFYADGEKRYILAPAGVAIGQTVMSGPEAPIEVGNAMPLSAVPLGSSVHCVELYAGRGGQMVRTAGASAQGLRNNVDGKRAVTSLEQLFQDTEDVGTHTNMAADDGTNDIPGTRHAGPIQYPED